MITMFPEHKATDILAMLESEVCPKVLTNRIFLEEVAHSKCQNDLEFIFFVLNLLIWEEH